MKFQSRSNQCSNKKVFFAKSAYAHHWKIRAIKKEGKLDSVSVRSQSGCKLLVDVVGQNHCAPLNQNRWTSLFDLCWPRQTWPYAFGLDYITKDLTTITPSHVTQPIVTLARFGSFSGSDPGRRIELQSIVVVPCYSGCTHRSGAEPRATVSRWAGASDSVARGPPTRSWQHASSTCCLWASFGAALRHFTTIGLLMCQCISMSVASLRPRDLH